VTERSCPGRDCEVSGGRGHRLGGSESGQGLAGRSTGPVVTGAGVPGRAGPAWAKPKGLWAREVILE
jgi:hypothetical protein